MEKCVWSKHTLRYDDFFDVTCEYRPVPTESSDAQQPQGHSATTSTVGVDAKCGPRANYATSTSSPKAVHLLSLQLVYNYLSTESRGHPLTSMHRSFAQTHLTLLLILTVHCFLIRIQSRPILSSNSTIGSTVHLVLLVINQCSQLSPYTVTWSNLRTDHLMPWFVSRTGHQMILSDLKTDLPIGAWIRTDRLTVMRLT